MTEYLINLARFVSYNEKKEIYRDLKNKGYFVSNDSWSYRRLIVNKPVKNKPFVASLIELKETFYQNNLSQTIDRLSKYKIKEIKAKIERNVPFHSKAITERYLKKYKFDPEGETIYLEARLEKDKVAIRLGFYLDDKENIPVKKEVVYPDIGIESPFTLGEVGDFLRLSKTFKTKVFIFTLNDPDCLNNIQNFLKENNFDKGNITIVKDIESFRNEYEIIGFSMWGKDPLETIIKNKEKKKLLLFGNERRGLLKKTMDQCNKIIKIGSSSEPLRATQAASFALGYIFSKEN